MSEMGKAEDKPTMPVLLSTAEVAGALAVSRRTVVNWIDKDSIPFLKLPGGSRSSYRIPLDGLLNSLGGNYDLTEHITSYLEKSRAE